AFQDAMSAEREPSASGSLTAPAAVDGDWYVAEHGVQSGPFDLARARAWVGERPASAEVFCWTDGFDDWQRVDRVAQFRTVQRHADDRPFAASAMPAAQVGSPFDAVPKGPDLEIGEVSRVVRLPIMP